MTGAMQNRTVSGTFPFGSKLVTVGQRDRSPKRVFVLGVYSSAVHAKWVGLDGRLCVRALAVAAEPVIFWNGSNAEDIIARIDVLPSAGRLVAADRQFNGPSGRSIDEDFLGPLDVGRDNAWLCDLVPHTCLNTGQLAAIRRAYEPRRRSCGLPEVDLPVVPEMFADDERRGEVLAELEEARAEIVVLLGDEPIRHFLSHHDARWRRLRDFDGYGRLHPSVIGGKSYKVLPLAHPRQVGGLGKHSAAWRLRHESWKGTAAKLCS
jgi:hypothetical protein